LVAHMKSVIKRLITSAADNDRVWAALDSTILRAARYADWERQKLHPRPVPSSPIEDSTVQAAVRAIVPDLTVRHGPFKGMKYPVSESMGSTLFPKLIGSYERELHPIIEAICRTACTDVVNIGCGEGYYSVGLAMRLSSANVLAFDVDERAVELCRKMAELNHVGQRVTASSSLCDPDTLCAIPHTGKLLVVSDCEGYERALFTEQVVAHLASHDVLIETHDFVDIEISARIRERFQRTHDVHQILSVDDIQKAHTYEYRELDSYDLQTRKVLLAESRPAIMEWLFMTSRSAPRH